MQIMNDIESLNGCLTCDNSVYTDADNVKTYDAHIEPHSNISIGKILKNL